MFAATIRFAVPWIACTIACGGTLARAQPRVQDRSTETQAASNEDQEIKIGYFGPTDSQHPDAGQAWQAAQLAIQRANREGGFEDKPFRLLSAWSEDPWGTGVKRLTKLVYEDRVWAIVGGIDGSTTHLAEQLMAKARLPLISPISTDRSVNLANVPWIFSVTPGDHDIAALLAAAVAADEDSGGMILVSADDHDSRRLTAELLKAFKGQILNLRHQYAFRRGTMDLNVLVERLVEQAPARIVIVADSADSARLVIGLRAAGFRGEIIGGPSMSRRHFQTLAGAAAEGLRFPLLARLVSELPVDEFEKLLRLDGVVEPTVVAAEEFDFAAAGTYDAIRILVAAIRRSGLDREQIGNAIRDLTPWEGIGGTIDWDAQGSNRREVRLGTIRDARIEIVEERR